MPGNVSLTGFPGSNWLLTGSATRTSWISLCLGSDAPRIDEVADGELRRERRLQPLGVQHQVIVQEARVGVERSHLLGAGLHHIWVAVAHWVGKGETPLVRHQGRDEATPTKYLQIFVSECLP